MPFNTAIIKKPKKFKGADKVSPSKLEGLEELNSQEASEKNVAEKVKPTPFQGADKMNSENLLSIDLILRDAKKPEIMQAEEDVNAYDKEAGKFKVEKDEAGMFKESGESAKKRYMDKIKSRKGM